MGSGEARYWANQREMGYPQIDHWSNGDEDDGPKVIGGLGGYVKGTGWGEYKKGLPSAWIPYFTTLRRFVLQTHLREGGFWHQNEGSPVFTDGTVIAMSFRAWGDFMASVWNSAELCHHYRYADFAWEGAEEYVHRSWNKEKSFQYVYTRPNRYHHDKFNYSLKGKEGSYRRMKKIAREYGKIDINLGR